MRSIRSVLVLSALASVAACNTPAVSPDAAGPDSATRDAAMVDAPARDSAPADTATADAATPDAATPDAAIADASRDASVDGGGACDTCTGANACLRGVCVATCGGDLDALDTALSAGLVPVANYCRTPTAFGFASGRVYEVRASTLGLVTTLTLARWTAGASGMPSVEALGAASHTAMDASEMVFAGGFVAVDPAESRVVFGYTTTLAGSVGGVFDLSTGSMVAMETSAPGNFDATFVDATHYVVDGLGLGASGGQGLYRGVFGAIGGVQVVDHVGQYSGSIALWGAEGLVLAGGGTFSESWPDGATGDRLLVFPAADLLAASAPIDGGTVQHVTMPSAFELIAGPRLASLHYDGTFAQDGIETRALSRPGGGPVVVGAPVTLTTGATFTAVGDAGSEIILAHGAGLLFVR